MCQAFLNQFQTNYTLHKFDNIVYKNYKRTSWRIEKTAIDCWTIKSILFLKDQLFSTRQERKSASQEIISIKLEKKVLIGVD